MSKIRKWAWLVISILLLVGSYFQFTSGNSKLALSYIVLGIGALVFTIIQFIRDRRDR